MKRPHLSLSVVGCAVECWTSATSWSTKWSWGWEQVGTEQRILCRDHFWWSVLDSKDAAKWCLACTLNHALDMEACVYDFEWTLLWWTIVIWFCCGNKNTLDTMHWTSIRSTKLYNTTKNQNAIGSFWFKSKNTFIQCFFKTCLFGESSLFQEHPDHIHTWKLPVQPSAASSLSTNQICLCPSRQNISKNTLVDFSNPWLQCPLQQM